MFRGEERVLKIKHTFLHVLNPEAEDVVEPEAQCGQLTVPVTFVKYPGLQLRQALAP